MESGAQPGNKNSTKGKPWRDAINWALENHANSQTDRAQALRDIATKMIDSALGGDLAAMKELGDRVEGKAAQSLEISANILATDTSTEDLLAMREKLKNGT